MAYGTFGIFACVGLLVHLMLTLALMTLIGSTLTLPGIAGLVLGVAMAVDANVLIYERIREELRVGKTPVSAIDAEFQRAFVTIADSQLTTLACAHHHVLARRGAYPRLRRDADDRHSDFDFCFRHGRQAVDLVLAQGSAQGPHYDRSRLGDPIRADEIHSGLQGRRLLSA